MSLAEDIGLENVDPKIPGCLVMCNLFEIQPIWYPETAFRLVEESPSQWIGHKPVRFRTLIFMLRGEGED